MLKLILSVVSLLTILSCSTAPKLGKATGTGEMLSGPINTVPVYDYRDPKMVAKKIRTECSNLGKVMSDSAVKFAKAKDVKIVQKNKVRKEDKGNNMIVEIFNAQSSGNAFIGHYKSMAIRGYLYSNGKLVDEVEFSRRSNGGMGGGFMGSCTVLRKVAKKLGEDLSLWAKKYSK